MLDLALNNLLGRIKFRNIRHHGEHDAHIAARTCAQHRAQLRAQETRTIKADTDRAPAQCRILLVERLHIRQDLVATDVERAESDRLATRSIHHGFIKRNLRLHPRELGGNHELQLSAEQADGNRTRLIKMRQINQQTCIQMQINRHPIFGDSWHITQLAILLLPTGTQTRLFSIGGFNINRRAHMYFTR